MRLVDAINGHDSGVEVPAPNEVPSKFVRECLATENEGDGMLFAALLENKLLYAAANESWYVWRGNFWQRDRTELVLGLVRYVTDRYGQEIVDLEGKINKSKQENDEEDHKIYTKGWNRKIELLQKKIKALRQEKGRNACVKFARTYFGNPFAIEGNEFDKDPWLLGVRNGVVDLRSGELYPGEPRQLVSKRCSCGFVPLDQVLDRGAWEQFLNDIFDGDQEIIEFMQILLGYGITGLTTEHVFPFLLGRGRNGKSLFIGAICRVLGDYAATVPCEIFLKSNQPRTANQTDPAIMKHEGLRIAMSSEVEEGARFSSQQVKRITGGDNLEGRNPYDKELREFKPTHLSLMIGNHEPVPPTGDPAFWDRTFLINFPIRFVKGNPDPEKHEKLADSDIEDKLTGMDEQILAWLIEGCLKWQAAGRKIVPPQSVLKSTGEYRDDADWIGQFVSACCSKSESETGSTTLYTAFTLWYRETINPRKDSTPSHRAFGLKMKACDSFQYVRRSEGVVYRGGVLNQTWQRRLMDEAVGPPNA
ncbi:phage/plasmid primase, P4 family [Desulfobulbus sp.]|uniref:DNA primase family protein n=1 Tax=Desulfobulbus sp. TaxID=895 RepID=UPI00286F59AF|nr:phage/plasmid primase, P4 family [Desulfobulbus sp.]